MPRPSIAFTESQQILIVELVNKNYTLDQVAVALKHRFDLKVSLPTLSNYIRSLGIARMDNRHKENPHKFKLEVAQERYIRNLYEDLGFPVATICEQLDKLYNIKVSTKTMAKYIKDKGWKRSEITTIMSDENLNFGDEQEMELEDTTIYSKELLNKMRKDENLRRFYLYQQGEDYNIYGEHGSLDTWFTRDGFPKIELSHSIIFNRDNTDYQAIGGQFRTAEQYEADMRFFTFSTGIDGRGDAAQQYRIELKEWYTTHRGEIQRLYDEIIQQNFARGIEATRLFNNLCKELYERKLGFGDVIHGKHSPIQQTLRGEMGLSMPNHFLK